MDDIIVRKQVKRFVCSICKKNFASDSDVTKHLLSYHFDDPTVIKINYGRLKSIREKEAKEQMKKKSKKPYKRKRSKTLSQIFTCGVCSYQSPHHTTFKRHLLTHEKGPAKRLLQHKCDYCSYTSAQSFNVKRHIRNVHPLGEIEPHVILVPSDDFEILKRSSAK